MITVHTPTISTQNTHETLCKKRTEGIRKTTIILTHYKNNVQECTMPKSFSDEHTDKHSAQQLENTICFHILIA